MSPIATVLVLLANLGCWATTTQRTRIIVIAQVQLVEHILHRSPVCGVNRDHSRLRIP